MGKKKGKSEESGAKEETRALLVQVPVAVYRKLVAEVRKREDAWEVSGRAGQRPTLAALVEERCR